MLLLATGLRPVDSLEACTALRELLHVSLPVAIIDGLGIEAASHALDPETLLTIMESIVDAHEAIGPHACVASVPDAWASEPEKLAFFLLRRHDQKAAIARFDASTPRAGVPAWASMGLDEQAVELLPWSPRPPRLETDRLVLTAATPAQVTDYYHRIKGTSMFEMLCWDGPESLDEMLDGLLKIRRNLARGRGGPTSLGIIEKESDAQIGGVSFRPHDAEETRADIGYTLAPTAQRKGYASEAVGEIVRFAFEERGCRRLEAEVFVGNDRSRALLERLGFELEGVKRQNHIKNGRAVDEWLFGLTRDRWKGR